MYGVSKINIEPSLMMPGTGIRTRKQGEGYKIATFALLFL